MVTSGRNNERVKDYLYCGRKVSIVCVWETSVSWQSSLPNDVKVNVDSISFTLAFGTVLFFYMSGFPEFFM